MTADAAPADTRPRPTPRGSRSPGPTRDELTAAARDLAAGMRRDARSCSRFERWLHVLDLLHRDPQLLAWVVLALTDPPDQEGVRH